MLVIPGPILLLILILTAWWSYRRVDKKEYLILALSFGTVYALLLILVHLKPVLCLYYHGPLGAAGFDSARLPRAVAVTAAIAAVPLKPKPLRIVFAVIAVAVGEFVLCQGPHWVS